jgi:hypothetical protein
MWTLKTLPELAVAPDTPWLDGVGFESLGWLLAALSSLALGRSIVLRFLTARTHRQRVQRGLSEERRAEALLKRAGYRIEESQAQHHWHVELDGEPLRVPLKVDYLVRRGRDLWVVDVKTGQGASPTSIATRRQLLEYSCAYGARGALLVDMDHELIFEFGFPIARAKASGARLPWCIAGLSLTALSLGALMLLLSS